MRRKATYGDLSLLNPGGSLYVYVLFCVKLYIVAIAQPRAVFGRRLSRFKALDVRNAVCQRQECVGRAVLWLPVATAT